MPKGKNKKRNPIILEDEKWKARHDASLLRDAKEIYSDKKRLEKASRVLKEDRDMIDDILKKVNQ